MSHLASPKGSQSVFFSKFLNRLADLAHFFQKPTDPPPRPFRPFFFLRGNVRPSRAAGVRVEAEFGQENPNTVPRELGSMGYVGDETIYVAWERMSGLG